LLASRHGGFSSCVDCVLFDGCWRRKCRRGPVEKQQAQWFLAQLWWGHRAGEDCDQLQIRSEESSNISGSSSSSSTSTSLVVLMRAHEKKMVSTAARSRRMQQMVVQSAGGLKMILVSSTVVVLLLLLLLTGSCCAQSQNQANAYLDQVEKEVMQIAAQASVNFLNTCGMQKILLLLLLVLVLGSFSSCSCSCSCSSFSSCST